MNQRPSDSWGRGRDSEVALLRRCVQRNSYVALLLTAMASLTRLLLVPQIPGARTIGREAIGKNESDRRRYISPADLPEFPPFRRPVERSRYGNRHHCSMPVLPDHDERLVAIQSRYRGDLLYSITGKDRSTSKLRGYQGGGARGHTQRARMTDDNASSDPASRGTYRSERSFFAIGDLSEKNRLYARWLRAQLRGDESEAEDIHELIQTTKEDEKRRKDEEEAQGKIHGNQKGRAKLFSRQQQQRNKENFQDLFESFYKESGSRANIEMLRHNDSQTRTVGGADAAASRIQSKRGSIFQMGDTPNYLDNGKDFEDLVRFALTRKTTSSMNISIEELEANEKRDSYVNHMRPMIEGANSFVPPPEWMDNNDEGGGGGDDEMQQAGGDQYNPAAFTGLAFALDPRSNGFRSDLIVSRGPLCFMVPTLYYPLARGHCWVVAIDTDSRCTMDLEDDALEDVYNYKKSIVSMNRRRGLRTVFFETAVQLEGAKRRPIVEAVALPEKSFASSRIFFKKAMVDAGSDWNTVSASGKKVLETSPGRHPLAHVLPRGDFPYFHVEFEMEGGYVHVIEDEGLFDLDFGRNVLTGLLGIDDANVASTSSVPSLYDQQQRAMDLRTRFKRFDWTPSYYAQAEKEVQEEGGNEEEEEELGRTARRTKRAHR